MKRLISAGCALQNKLLLATAMGYDSALTSGKALKSKALRKGFGLKEGEHAVCFLSIGTELAKAPQKLRKKLVNFFAYGNLMHRKLKQNLKSIVEAQPQIPRHFSQRHLTHFLELVTADFGNNCNATEIYSGHHFRNVRFQPRAPERDGGCGPSKTA